MTHSEWNNRGETAPLKLSDIALARPGGEREALVERLNQEIQRLRQPPASRHTDITPEEGPQHHESGASLGGFTRLKKMAQHVYSGRPAPFPAPLILSQSEVAEMVLTLREHREQFWLNLFTLPVVQVERIRELRSLLEENGPHYKGYCFFTKRGQFSAQNIMQERGVFGLERRDISVGEAYDTAKVKMIWLNSGLGPTH